VAEEVELDVLMLASPIIVLAVHDLGLLRVKLKTALLQTLPDRLEHVLRLSPALGVNDHIIRIALELDVRIGPGHPVIERIMHEEICQQGRYDRPLWRTLRSTLLTPVLLLNGGYQPPLDVQQDPRSLHMMANRFHDQFMIQIIKETFDIEIDHPVGPPTSLPRGGDRIQRRSSGTIPVGVGMEMRLHQRLQMHLDDHLRHAVADRGNAQSALPPHPNRLRDSSPSPIPTIRSADNGSRSSGSAGELIRISSSDSRMDGTPPFA